MQLSLSVEGEARRGDSDDTDAAAAGASNN
jgi:hypothetical protein